ncbi:NADH-ubiquinone oxidoreductase-F iron-sulfur binding region domain-containing protein [Actinacidiphila bryophytorum]|uniref:Fe-S, FMN containing oxidoreductase n=1 Tax=Actinacidiphila bryophytorum TaxID=1436133 RepID=A0A9W4H1S7_9ACTN|nr:NADH-ubiquinone oxidoreductase-F iron-sulfur binding region domain-containing protein [Actinacidiphila bryophytorum]MBM9435209.1 SLBB domain-containing protein [Actinacidiphila bryophytorum]MBN6541590.1 SLBB domain-containing protein [Actinacidiphila bryophytorum]CAG7643727.1 putative Fe-S, FMN containing oxidoreductase [Actinacidiphila bryophytorum]
MNHDTTTAFAAEDLRVPNSARLLHGWFATGRATDLAEHLARYGPAPVGTARSTLADAVERAGLAGRGGGGFPTGRKLRTVAGRRGPAVVIANGMESEPASRKDETLLSLVPHLVLDGAVLAAAAAGANTVHLCVPRTRDEQAQRLALAVDERQHAGIDPVEVRVHMLPHHFVSSEETALVNWLNGGPARPRPTPPRPFEKGVGKRPTFVANVETLAHVALIARYGPDWFREAGSPQTPGTTLVTLSGAIASPGVYEVPMGSPVGQALAAAGGPTRRLSAVLAGGFFGSWLPVPLDPAAPARGAGVLVALPEDACGLAETAAALAYLGSQSARQCGPCRFGVPSVADDFAELAWGQPGPALTERLDRRLGLLPGRGACRHPDGAARLAASALQVFSDDVQRHVRYGPCSHARDPLVLAIPDARPPAEEEWR